MEQRPRYLRARPQREYSYQMILGIDWGSEAVRASVYQTLDNGMPVESLVMHRSIIEELQLDREEVERQFSSHIYPFDHHSRNNSSEMVYQGNNRVPGRRSISSKLAMYAVVGISDEIARQSPQLQELLELVQQTPQLKRVLRLGIEQMFRVVLQNVCLYLEGQNRRIGAIALTIPAQWTIDFEEEYGERFVTAWAQAFHYAAPEIIFLTEGQTNVHFAFYTETPNARFDRHILRNEGFLDSGRISNGLLLFDAGGHSTNCSLVTICQDNNQLEVLPDRGVIGGTALWAWYVLRLAKTKWPLSRNYGPMPVEMENEILKTFYTNCRYYRGGKGTAFYISDCGPNHSSFRFAITAEELMKTFDDANAHTFALIEDGILQLKGLEPLCEKLTIMVGGGSAQGAMYARLAAGANYALLKAKTVAQFADKAAFGLAIKKRYRDGEGWAEDWYYQANLLWARGNKWARFVTTDGTEEFKIICQPEYNSPRSKSTIEPNYKAYDLLPIPCRERGILQFELDLNTETDTLSLTVKHRAQTESGKTQRSTQLGHVEFDLWVPPGSRCLQIWDCVEDIKSKVTAAFAGQQEPAGNNALDGTRTGEMEVELGHAEEPAQSARSLRRSLRNRPPQPPRAETDMDVDIMALDEDQDVDVSMLGTALPPQAEAPQPSSGDVEMGGTQDAEEFAGSINVASPMQLSQPTREVQSERHRRRRGSRVPTGIFAL
ncbi:hypothetical protein J7T55_010574 [Diaporthe amygdali]|uniref:uncharacterized protein n=1 Tax=Phomopsis amygdali TaxID=1214568 RepID=UPI0022FDCC22|nr:uncharacterized protein J7T55_010574 [Diaporthe amygdali]KAJ0115751.1 hypothetical protein J7T55_010574 [Diaporthe amygdali]